MSFQSWISRWDIHEYYGEKVSVEKPNKWLMKVLHKLYMILFLMHPETYPELSTFCGVTPPPNGHLGGVYTFLTKSMNFDPMVTIQNINSIFDVIPFCQKTFWMRIHVIADVKHIWISKFSQKKVFFQHLTTLRNFDKSKSKSQ